MADLTPNDLSHLSDEEFLALCPQGEHAPGPEPLSPAAEAVWTAYETADCDPYLVDPRKAGIAAAIRELADQVVPEAANAVGDEHDDARRFQWMQIRRRLLAIATELECQ